MNKIKGSYFAKLTAWMLFLLGVAGTVIFGMLVIVYISEDFYEKTYEEAKQDTFRWVNVRYSRQAFEQMGVIGADEAMAAEYFRYGIIKTDGLSTADLENLDFNQKETYRESNFFLDEMRINPDALEVYQITQRGDRTYGSLYGNYREYVNSLKRFEETHQEDNADKTQQNPEADLEWHSQYADAVCYDRTGGIFYYKSEGEYYPVQNVTLPDYNGHSYHYSYDFGNRVYKLNYTWPTEENNGIYETPDGTAGDTAAMDAVEYILKGDGTGTALTFNMLDATVFNYTNWGELLLDDIRNIDSRELQVISSENIPENLFVTEAGYYLDENYSLIVARQVSEENYWVVSLLPDKVPLHSDNMYAAHQWMLDAVYTYAPRDMAVYLAGFALLALASAVFLTAAAGHRRKREEIVLLPCPDKIPLELWTVLCVCAGTAPIAVLYQFAGETTRFPELFVGIVVAAVLGLAVVVLWYWLSLAVRVKNGKWWHNTVCYFIYSRIRRFLRTVGENMDLLWKLIAGGVALCALELFLVMIAFETDFQVFIMLWFAEKIVLGILLTRLALQLRLLQEGSRHLADGELRYQINTEKLFPSCRVHGENLNRIGIGMSKAVDERMKSERLKTELITNVSHDIKTPLTSIINYVDLLGKEELHNEKAAEYLEVLERQSSKLKKLIEDLVEASKASTGNLAVASEQLEVGVFLTQTVGEFEERLAAANLELVVKKTESPVYIMADGRHLWRVVDNLMNNVCKYAQPYSRVYVNLEREGETAVIAFRNMSKYPLNINGEELMERFVRGDESRNTEGHGLGLSIAKSLMDLMDGKMQIYVDGDLFKVLLIFQCCEKAEEPSDKAHYLT